MRFNEHRFITFLAYSKQVPKDSSLEDEVEEQATPLRVLTAERCCCHQDGGRGRVEGHLQEDGGGGSLKGLPR